MAQGAVKKNGKRSQAVSAKKEAILAAALEAFSQFGIHGTRLEQVAERAGVSKTNLLYYYPSKEALYVAVLQQILAIWLAPLKSRDHPQASKLFCLEMLQGAPLLMGELTGDLKALVDEKSAIVSGWIDRGKLAPVDPQHLIFMIWATTQHYADFATQVEAVTGATLQDAAFFEQTVDNVQRMIIEGIRVR